MHPKAQQIINQVDAFLAKHPKYTLYDQLVQLEIKTGQPKALFFIAGVLALFGSLVLVAGGKLIVDLAGFVYPAYMSFKSLEAQHDETEWLTYWVVFSSFSILESFLSPLVNLVPFYLWIKVAFIIFMYHPSTKGALMIYQQALRPLLLPYLEVDKSAATKKIS
ncbi:hypothetical protein MPSEU_000433300 [Mayamaea pseudoterrestris]|nr:hypothetical protein MPSEU_000433300 [Mayamaea pseudoterrestris]